MQSLARSMSRESASGSPAKEVRDQVPAWVHEVERIVQAETDQVRAELLRESSAEKHLRSQGPRENDQREHRLRLHGSSRR